MLTPTIDFGEISITLPCALKDIGDVTVDEKKPLSITTME